MAETEQNGRDGVTDERVRALELRVEKLEKRLAALAGAKKPAAGAARAYRDSLDALDYPDR